MKTALNTVALVLLFGATIALAPGRIFAQDASTQSPSSSGPKSTTDGSQGDVYYYFTMGHLLEEQYEITNNSDAAAQSVDFYKKALELEPNAPVVMERLAEIYAKSQRIREAVAEAQLVLQADADNVAAHRLLARVYVRSLGDMSGGPAQEQNLARAIEQFQAILKIEPNDAFSALWLARLYRFENRHDEAEKVLRSMKAGRKKPLTCWRKQLATLPHLVHTTYWVMRTHSRKITRKRKAPTAKPLTKIRTIRAIVTG
jgi:tetratricopeptide (TPR) repeat protein